MIPRKKTLNLLLKRIERIMQLKNILLFVFLLVMGCFLFSHISELADSLGYEKSHCVRIPVKFFPFSWKPLIKVEIEKKQYAMFIDTGSAHSFALQKKALEHIKDKNFVDTSISIDVLGREYSTSQFLVPEVRIGSNLRFNTVDVYEENIDFLTKIMHKDESKSLFRTIKKWLRLWWIDGRIGWPVFAETACLFNFHDGELFLAKDLNALREENVFFPEEFVKAPLELSECGIMIVMQTELGLKKFALDTGASYSVFREIGEQLKDSVILTMNVSGQNLGRWEFILFPLSSEHCKFDGILGVDFFKRHKICCDFERKILYIRKSIEI